MNNSVAKLEKNLNFAHQINEKYEETAQNCPLWKHLPAA